MTGSLMEVALGRRDPGWIAELLSARDRSRAGPTAPPQGLCLARLELELDSVVGAWPERPQDPESFFPVLP